MNGRFWFYRRRRTLPFAAAWCLVFVNGATLQPLAVPPELLEGVAAGPAPVTAAPGADARQRPRYERGCGGERSPAVVANVPPLVKNLRRPAPTRLAKAVVRGPVSHPTDAPRLTSHCTRRFLAVNTADLSCLCRLLL